MKKIHNNLTIENLIKTDWFKQFNEYQQKEILEGLKYDVDVLIYAKPEFDYKQMQEIRYGLEAKVDVSIYATSEYNWEQMNEIIKRKWNF